MKMRAPRRAAGALATRRTGFTMMELLTVIAIIALLAAVLYPVMAAVRRTVWKSNCMNNMHQISQALNLYQDTWNRYPLVLDAVVIGNATPPMTVRPLFPAYAKSEDIFHCSINAYRATDSSQAGGFTAGQLVTPVKRINGQGTSGPLRACLDSRGGPRSLRVGACGANETTASPVQFPMRTSYDGAFVPNQTNAQWEVHYSRDWTESAPSATDIPRQLKYRFPPANTVITWCMNHVDNFDANGIPHGPVPTLFRDGTVRQLRGERFVDWPSTVQPQANGTLGVDGTTWRVLP